MQLLSWMQLRSAACAICFLPTATVHSFSAGRVRELLGRLEANSAGGCASRNRMCCNRGMLLKMLA